jgi:peroxiredoxin
VRVIGVSPDSVEDVSGFAQKHGLNFTLLADADHAVSPKTHDDVVLEALPEHSGV